MMKEQLTTSKSGLHYGKPICTHCGDCKTPNTKNAICIKDDEMVTNEGPPLLPGGMTLETEDIPTFPQPRVYAPDRDDKPLLPTGFELEESN